MSAVRVGRHAGVRLAGLLLAASGWPEAEQARKAYKPHRVAEGARRAFGAWRAHPAVQAAEAVALGPGGVGQLLALAAAGNWAVAAGGALDDFVQRAEPEAYWAATAGDWQAAETELGAVLARADLGAFLAALVGGPLPTLTVLPTLLYPGRERVVAETPDGLVLSQPPPPAWGTSPPWRYHERPDEVLAATAEALATALLARAGDYPALQAQAAPVGLAAAVLFVRAAEGPEAADQFMLMEKRTRQLPHLPALVAALDGRRGLAEVAGVVTAQP